MRLATRFRSVASLTPPILVLTRFETDKHKPARGQLTLIANVIAVRRNAISRSDDNNETNGESLSMFSCTPADDETRAIRPVFVVSRDLCRLLDE